MAKTDADAPARAWQRMLSGRRLDLLDPSPLDIEIEDIAHGLARVARWNGQTIGEHVFSVAQHSLVVEQIVKIQGVRLSNRERLAVLLHDAPEYVIGDMISPFKAVIGTAYKAVEERLLTAIHQRFEIAAPLPAAVKRTIKAADQISAYYEAVRLAGFETTEAVRWFGRPRGIDPNRLTLEPWPTPLAEARFLDRFQALNRRRRASRG